MAHKEQTNFCEKIKRLYPDYFIDKYVLEVGSFNVNGTIRDLFERCRYTGLDIEPGNGVDIACPAQEYSGGAGYFDTIVSCECLEHNPHWAATIHNIVRMLAPEGLFLFTCASKGRPIHGVASLEQKDNPNWVTMPNVSSENWDNEYYRNLVIADILPIIDFDLYFSEYGFEVNNNKCDLYFWGIKKP